MKKSRFVQIALVKSVAAALVAGCDSKPEYTQVCVDDQNKVTDFARCEAGEKIAASRPAGYNHGFHWYFIPGMHSLRAGQVVAGGSLARPAGFTPRTAGGSSGTTQNGYVRHGFGSSARSGGRSSGLS